MKMAHDMKLARSCCRVELQKFGFGLVVGCLLVSLACVSVFDFDAVSSLNSTSSSSSPSHRVEDIIVTSQQSDRKDEKQEIGLPCKLCEKKNAAADTADNNNGSYYTVDSLQKTTTFGAKRTDERADDLTLKKKPMCDFSSSRTDVCEIEGDVRILGKNATVFLVNNLPDIDASHNNNETWRIKPYPRKADNLAMSSVREFTLKPSKSSAGAPRCTDRYDVPAVVFSVRGYTGNYFHAFTDVFVPLFDTARGFDGEVRLLITGFRAWWIRKFLPIFQNLSRYDMIDLDGDDRVLCFPRAVVGLRSRKDLSIIDPAAAPHSAYSVADFAAFMRRAYSLERDSAAVMIGNRRPRLLIVARERTRKFVNLEGVIRLAEGTGYEVVVAAGKLQADLGQFSRIVNSCDVMMGVHGAGLTNIVFLPTSAVLIQIVPWGGLNWVARTCFGEPSREMRLKYLEYGISKEESTLTEQYPRDHAVFTDPASIRKKGWIPMREVFLDKQDVRLDLRRFKPVLEKALELLRA